MLTITPKRSQWPQSWTWTLLPIQSGFNLSFGISQRVLWLACRGKEGERTTGQAPRKHRPKKSLAGEAMPLLRTMLRHVKRASSKSEAGTRWIRPLRFLTPASAWPFDWELYGDDTSCWIPKSAQNFANWLRNWGPPSDQSAWGNPKVLNHPLRRFTTVSDVRDCNLAIIG